MMCRLFTSHLLAFGALSSWSFLFAVEITPERMGKEAAKLDILISSVLEKSGKTKPAPIDDFNFLRRASLVAIGRIPTLAEIKEFANDPAADKRNRLVNRLYRSKGLSKPHEQLVL